MHNVHIHCNWQTKGIITCIRVCVLYFALVPCPPLSDPNNGMINCSLGDDGDPSYEDICSFTCNTGYELTGSDTRTCQSDGSWSGNDVVCRRGMYLCCHSYGIY